MDESFSPSYNHLESPKIYLGKPAGSSSSGLKLVLPSLKTLKASQKSKHRSASLSHPASVFQDADSLEKKNPRAIKLKPLKEVLAKLIAQIKKKDDYAFFLHPVIPEKVVGYSDIVKRPMDFGTMTDKVNRGKYRSLEDFASDFRLVTTNAKMFNPPGTIYHIEADRIEVWGLDHISKAASTVIQYETDWNIEIEKDDDLNVDDDEDGDAATPMDVDSTSLRERSVSVASQPQPGPSRRGPRGPYKKQGQNANGNGLSETLEADGGLPGSKDGIGAFPPGSDWAKTMVALKLKGKRYKTKKERMRIEREGPPLLADGSLDYSEMEDPFSVLSFFVPDPPTRPHLVPLYPPSQPTQAAIFPSATTVPPDHPIPSLPFIQPDNSGDSNRRRHWTITRNATSRQKGKERDDEQEVPDVPLWQMPREAHALDFGSFAVLAGELAEEMRRRGLDEKVSLDIIRNSLDCDAAVKKDDGKTSFGPINGTSLLANAYWTSQRAAEAEDYIRDVVYGGVDGFAYVRSLAEFVEGSTTLAKWVEDHIVDPLTEDRHSLLRETARQLVLQRNCKPHFTGIDGTVASQVVASLHVYPAALVALSALLHIRMHKIDMGSLIKTPDELFLSEEEWAGKGLKEKRRNKRAKLEEDAMEVEEPEQTWAGVDASVVKRLSDYELEGPEELSEVLQHVAGVILELDRRNRAEKITPRINGTSTLEGASLLTTTTTESTITVPATEKPPSDSESVQVALQPSSTASEDPVVRNLRLNLLALAKRAPLDTIARLPKDLVPEHIRHFVPTLGSTN
ncbi:hypothetical protein B0H34DRAFT_132874 [Crassisporium funariophilum]|nr:hypothetical protein B0H34DRAFT_132874 [Crassisporium funariophilum]